MGCSDCLFKKANGNKNNSPHIPDTLLNSCNKLNTYDLLKDIPDTSKTYDLVEVRFKNTRKEFYRNTNNLELARGDVIAVEASSGHDVGIVSLTGRLALLQFKRKNKNPGYYKIKQIYRKASVADLQKWKEAKGEEHSAMLKIRKISKEMGLSMKVGDVEYQGDKKRVLIYYIADERVDFRELIKVLAKELQVRIEMKQIGARQEAGRISGIGSCGRELCCSTWRTNLVSVPLSSARYQDLSPNVQKLTGQCGKLKCCLMYELDTYLEVWEDFPEILLQLETKKSILYRHKVDILKKTVWYSYDKESPTNLIAVSIDRIKEIIMMNKKGIKPEVM